MAFQRRFDGSVEFFSRKWFDYKHGFGDPNGEYYLGNEMLHLLTTGESHDYRVEATTFNNEMKSKVIQNVVVAGEDDKYRIKYEASSVDWTAPVYGERFRNKQFSTSDNDNDDTSLANCAQVYGPWWHSGCHSDGMNGYYKDAGKYVYSAFSWTLHGEGIHWNNWKGIGESLKISLLMIRPTNFKA